MTDFPGSTIFDALRRRTGVSVIARSTAGQFHNADAAVFYDAPRPDLRLSPSCAAIEAVPGALEGLSCSLAVSGLLLRLAGERQRSLIPGYPAEKLLAAALDAGTLTPEEILLQDVRIAENNGAFGGTLDKEASIYYNECSYTIDN
jgi:hypothetical protein